MGASCRITPAAAIGAGLCSRHPLAHGVAPVSGPAWMMLGIAVFALLDVNTKWLSAGYGMGQVLLVRYLVMLGLLLPFVGGVRPGARVGLHALRGVLMLGASMAFFHAFAHLPLFDGYIVFFTAPFMVMALARVMLDERVPRAAWGWALFGFAGVVLALAPRLDAGAAHAAGPLLAALGGTFAYALVLILTRRAAGAPLSALMLWPAGIGTVGTVPLAVLDWTPPGATDFALLAANGGFWAAALACVARAVQLAPPSRLAILDFTSVVWVIGFDRFLFGYRIGVLELAGAAVVLLACLFHARVMARAASSQP